VCQRCIKWRGRCDGYEERLDAQSRRSGARNTKPPSVEPPSPPTKAPEQPQCWYTAIAVETEKLLRRPSAVMATTMTTSSPGGKVKEEPSEEEEEEEEEQRPGSGGGDSARNSSGAVSSFGMGSNGMAAHEIGLPCDDNFWRGIVPVLLRNNASVWYANLAIHALIDAKRPSVTAAAAAASSSISSTSPASTTTPTAVTAVMSSTSASSSTTTSPNADGIATMTMSIPTQTPANPGGGGGGDSYSRALRYHGMALSEVRNEVVGRGNLQIVTLCCLFFILFQTMNGDEKAAQTHMYNGRKVMAELQRQSQGRPPANPDAVLHKELQKALRFLSMQVRGFHLPSRSSSLSPAVAIKTEK
jgi:hypothetical protein